MTAGRPLNFSRFASYSTSRNRVAVDGDSVLNYAFLAWTGYSLQTGKTHFGPALRCATKVQVGPIIASQASASKRLSPLAFQACVMEPQKFTREESTYGCRNRCRTARDAVGSVSK